MAILDELEVSIIAHDGALAEYSDPDRKHQSSALTTEKYIEASTGSKFAVRYCIKSTFNLHHAQGVHISIYTDGQYATGRNISEDKLCDQGWAETIETMTYFCHDRGTWMDAKMAFGGIRIVESVSNDASDIPTECLGALKVELRRVIKRKHTGSQLIDIQSPISGEISEKALKGRAITNRVMGVDGSARAGPLPPSGYMAMDGEYGQPFSFTFYYRSRNALQILGCIPRSPSPCPIEKREPASPTIRNEGASEFRQDPKTLSKEEEILRLRARLAELGEEITLEKERALEIRQSNSKIIIKRERAGQDTLSRKRVKAIEIIDLTEN